VKKVLLVTFCLMSGVLLLRAFAQTTSAKPLGGGELANFHLATPGQPIAGIPHDEALKIAERHAQELHQLPGTISISFTAEGLVVRTANPEVLPASVEGLPIFAIAPIDPNAVGALQKGLPPRSAPPPPIIPSQDGGRPVPPAPRGEPCVPGYKFDPVTETCINTKNEPEPPPPQPAMVEPPPGVIVLRPGKMREQAEKCPETFKEVEGYNNWRFCVDPKNPEPIPPLWSPPIAGIPFEKALEIHERRVLELRTLPGVESVGLGADGIHIYTSKPEVVPKEVEGLPIKVFPATGGSFSNLTHTYNTSVRPLHGAVVATDSSGLGGYGTLTGIVLADGKPWVILPAHSLSTCANSPPCSGGPPLNRCCCSFLR